MNDVKKIALRFRGFLPVVVDIETAGLNCKTDAILEIATIIINYDIHGKLSLQKSNFCHVLPFVGANLDKEALEFNGIDPYQPLRFAVKELDALNEIFIPINKEVAATGCKRAILVGHNPTFDLNFLRAAVKRCDYKHDPFHKFTTFDTATLAGVALGHTVLAVACQKANIAFSTQDAHSALYDATKTAELFCHIVNNFRFC